ncbi:MAG: hypothetical protein HZB53_15140 [Chloroflexi bacterium]|nr:hypothetical protein [Chloroflexota bacterium]
MTRIGEIIETSSTAVVAESVELNQAPALGSLCEMQSRDGRTLYAVVSFGRTAGFDPGRRAVRRGSDTVADAELYRQSPELNRILRTEFSAALAGWQEPGGRIWQRLPPQPPPLHYSVHACPPETVARFSESLGYLRLLLNSMGDLSPDQLIAANVRAVYAARGDDGDWLARAGREVASLLKNDYDRLMTVLQAIEP